VPQVGVATLHEDLAFFLQQATAARW
jgi:hypothetical protein